MKSIRFRCFAASIIMTAIAYQSVNAAELVEGHVSHFGDNKGGTGDYAFNVHACPNEKGDTVIISAYGPPEIKDTIRLLTTTQLRGIFSVNYAVYPPYVDRVTIRMSNNAQATFGCKGN